MNQEAAFVGNLSKARVTGKRHWETITGKRGNQSSALTRSRARSNVASKKFSARRGLRASGEPMPSFCAACGNSIAEGERFCRVCGREVTTLVTPAGSPQTPGGPAENSGKAILSLVCGFLFFVPLAFVAAIVFGHIALSEIKKSAGRLKGEGMAIAGLVLGYLWIVSIPIILIIAAIAIPNLLRARMAANEASAVAGVRTLVMAEASYATLHSNAGFTCSLSELAGDGLITSDLASGQKTGYSFELQDCTADAGGANVKFQVVAYPLTRNQTGIRAFCSDESNVIKVDANGSAQGCLENGSPLQ